MNDHHGVYTPLDVKACTYTSNDVIAASMSIYNTHTHTQIKKCEGTLGWKMCFVQHLASSSESLSSLIHPAPPPPRSFRTILIWTCSPPSPNSASSEGAGYSGLRISSEYSFHHLMTSTVEVMAGPPLYIVLMNDHINVTNSYSNQYSFYWWHILRSLCFFLGIISKIQTI